MELVDVLKENIQHKQEFIESLAKHNARLITFVSRVYQSDVPEQLKKEAQELLDEVPWVDRSN